MSKQFFRSNRPGYLHPVCSELESSGIRVAVGDCSVTGHRRWCLPYQTGKLNMCRQIHNKHDEDGSTAPDVRSHGSIPLSHSGNVIMRIGLHTHSSDSFSYFSMKTYVVTPHQNCLGETDLMRGQNLCFIWKIKLGSLSLNYPCYHFLSVALIRINQLTFWRYLSESTSRSFLLKISDCLSHSPML